jgi:hypothetical protein
MTGDEQDSNSFAGQRKMASLALAVLTMRADTPAGEWLESTYGSTYFDIWHEARDLAGDEADEDMFLNMLNFAATLLDYLEDETGRASAHWIERIRHEYIESIEGDDEGPVTNP